MVMLGGVQVVINMIMDPMVVAFSPTALAEHVFSIMVLATPKWVMVCLVFFSDTFLQGK